MSSHKIMVLGPLVIFEDCPHCKGRMQHERYYSRVWGEIMRRCLTCGREVVDQVIR